ncbi:MAG: hypothetical protein PHI29_01575 [Gallionella sp.]|nr:hypothetical protein [Gallionella sp.]
MKILPIILSIMLLCSGQAIAGGAASGGASEWTQVLNFIKLTDQYFQQVLQYQNQVLQYEAQIRNLQNNPVNVSMGSLQQLADNQKKIESGGHEIAKNMANVDKNFSKAFTNPDAAGFGLKFDVMANKTLDSLHAAALNGAGMKEKDDKQNLTGKVDALGRKAQAADGEQAQLQALASINHELLVQITDLKELLRLQQAAQTDYMATQTKKDQAKNDAQEIHFKAVPVTPESAYKSRKF